MATIAEHEAVPDDDPINKPAVWVDQAGVAWYRMSALGMCDKALLALRQGYTPKAPPQKMQTVYDEGHLHEDQIMARCESEFGVTITGRQDEVVIAVGTGVRIIGHIDGRGIWGPHDHEPNAVVDGKTASKDQFPLWDKVQSGADLAKLFPYYWWQMGGYLAAAQHRHLDWGVFAVKNKNSGEMNLVVLGRDEFPTLGQIVQRVMTIEKQVYDDLPVGKCPKPSWPCPVFYLHDEEPIESLTEEAAAEIEPLIVDFRAAQAAKKLAETREKDAKNRLVKRLGVQVTDSGVNVKPFETPEFKRVSPYRGSSAGGVDWDKVLEWLKETHDIEVDVEEFKKDPTYYIAFRITERPAGEGMQASFADMMNKES